MNDEVNIYLLEPIDETAKLSSILIWSDTEKTARTDAYTQPAQVDEPGKPTAVLQDSPYEDPNQVTCTKLTEGKNYQIIRSLDAWRTIEIDTPPYSLTKDYPVDLH